MMHNFRTILLAILLVITPITAYSGQILLAFDAQIGTYAVGDTVTGISSGATGKIFSIDDAGVTGILNLVDITGTFVNNEITHNGAFGADAFAAIGDFEVYVGTQDDGTSDTYTGWANDGINDGAGDKAEATATAQNGLNAVKITKTVGSVTVKNPNGSIAVVASTYYRLRMYSKGNGSVTGWYSVYDRSNGGWIQASVSTGITGTSYAVTDCYFTTPVGCTTIDMQLKSGVGFCYFDNLTIQPVTNYVTVNGIAYGGGGDIGQW